MPVPALGNQVYANVFRHVGFFGNPTNSDLANETLRSYTPRNCFYRNVDLGGAVTSAPADIQSANVNGQPCGGPGNGNDPALTDQLVCTTGFLRCPLPPHLAHYPKQTAHRDAAPAPAAEHAGALRGRAEDAFCP